MEISFSDQNDTDLAAKRAKLMARLQKRRVETVNTSKKSANELDELLQRANEEVEAKKIGPQTIESLEKMIPTSTGRVLKRIQDTLEELRKIELAQSQPQRTGGFSFVRKAIPTTPPVAQPQKQANTPNSESVLAPIRADNAMEIFDKENATETITGTDGTSVSLKKLNNCVLRFAFSPSAVHLKDVKDCSLLFSCVESSILMHDVIRSRVFAVAQQIRVHDSVDLELHVSVKGAVILEGCQNVTMAPYRLSRNGAAFVDTNEEQWKKPLDFDWLSSEPSPNWHLMDEKGWICEELLL